MTTISGGVPLKTALLSIAPGIRVVPICPSHAAELAHLVQSNRDHLRTYLPQVTALATPEAARQHLDDAIGAALEGDLLEWHIYDGDSLCGAVRVNHIEAGNHKAAIAYYLDMGRQGKGLATASVRAVLRYCFETLGFNRFELKCVSTNTASQRVAERLGFAREGLLRQAEYLHGEYVDHVLYALLREDFREVA